VRNLIGHGARVLIERAAALHGVTFSATRLDQLTNEFVELLPADIARESRPFDGVVEALDILAAWAPNSRCAPTSARALRAVA
jgi:phosphoglycolate phosphatase